MPAAIHLPTPFVLADGTILAACGRSATPHTSADGDKVTCRWCRKLMVEQVQHALETGELLPPEDFA